MNRPVLLALQWHVWFINTLNNRGKGESHTFFITHSQAKFTLSRKKFSSFNPIQTEEGGADSARTDFGRL